MDCPPSVWHGVAHRRNLLRDSTLTDGCVGTEVNQGLLKVGDTQHMQFQVGDNPPWYDQDALVRDLKWSEMSTEVQKKYEANKANYEKKAINKAKKAAINLRANRDKVAADIQTREQVLASLPEYIAPGYEGKQKGMKQILWERGFWKNGMHMRFNDKTRAEKMNKGIVIDETLDAETLLLSLPDFKHERTLLDEELARTGDMVLYSPKCHPEIAGVGIEYCIGYSKMNFRRKFNDTINAHLYENTIGSIFSVTNEKVWKFSRRSRDYLHVYSDLMNGYDVDGQVDLTGEAKISHAKMEDMRKACKSHRNIHDIEIKFLTAEMEEDKVSHTPVHRNRIPDLPGFVKNTYMT
jgi:hypothetical protein